MKTKAIIVLLVLGLLGSNVFWLYVFIDQGISYSYLQDSHRLAEKQFEQSLLLANLELKGLTAAAALERIGRDVYGLEPFVKDNCIWAGDVCVALQDNRVAQLRREPL